VSVAIDTGPIVALLDRRDAYHSWARDVFADTEPPLHTCEAVIAEACFLVRELRGGPDAVLELIDRKVLSVAFRADPEWTALRALMARFASVPMSFADACLVRMLELDPRLVLMTLDNDFRVYRKNKRQVIPLIFPRS
jgi:predicted nucleic acid-binding protein